MRPFDFYAPTTVVEALTLLDQYKDSVACIAGGTDLTLELNEWEAQPAVVIDLKKLKELDYIKVENGIVRIGALTSHAEVAANDIIRENVHILYDACRQVGSPQIRNLATLGGSLYSRFGFSDVLTIFLALNASVELYKGGVVPLSEYAQRPYDRDILVRVLVPKEHARFCYQSVRNSQTDFPVLTCAAARLADGSIRAALGARPGKAVLYTAAPQAGETAEAFAARFAAEVKADIKTESNIRGSAAYRRHLAGVLTKRAVCRLEG